MFCFSSELVEGMGYREEPKVVHRNRVGHGSFDYLPKLLLDLCVKCIQLLFDGILSLGRGLCSNVSWVLVANGLFLTSNFICESLNIKSLALSLILLKVMSP